MALALRSKVSTQEDYARMVDGIMNNDILIIPKGGKVEMAEDGMSGSFSMPAEEGQLPTGNECSTCKMLPCMCGIID